MKKKNAKTETKASRAEFRAAYESNFNQSPLGRAAYRLAIVAAPFAASGQSEMDAVESAESLIRACSHQLHEHAHWNALMETEGYDGQWNLAELRREIQASDKTLRSYVLEASRLDDEGNPKGQEVTDEDGMTNGEKIWKRLLARESVVSTEMLKVMQKLRAKRFAESRKKVKKPVK